MSNSVIVETKISHDALLFSDMQTYKHADFLFSINTPDLRRIFL